MSNLYNKFQSQSVCMSPAVVVVVVVALARRRELNQIGKFLMKWVLGNREMQQRGKGFSEKGKGASMVQTVSFSVVLKLERVRIK